LSFHVMPDDFKDRIEFIENFSKVDDSVLGKGFKIFNNDSLISYYLPGAMPGQFGLMMKFQDLIIFMCSDAAWCRSNLDKNELPTKRLLKQSYTSEPFIETHMKLIDFKHSSNKNLFILPSHCKKMDDFEEVLKLLDALINIYDNISDYMEILEAIMDKAKRYFYISVVLMIISLFLSAQNLLI